MQARLIQSYIIAKLAGLDGEEDGGVLFAISCVATATTMFFLGVVSGKFTKSNVWATALAALAIACGVLDHFIAVLGKVSHVWS